MKLDISLLILFVVHTNCNNVGGGISDAKLKAFDKNYYDLSADWDFQYSQVASGPEKVNIQVYYEVFCPHCRNFDMKQFRPVVENLSPFLNIKTYPYGNAKTVENDGKIKFICQHGPSECYGNKLHACALDIVKNQTAALIYNICLMEYSHTDLGSDDHAADKCGSSMSIDSAPIKQCAKGKRGNELLYHYGVESKKANFKHVPHVLINGVQSSVKKFRRDVCATFAKPPKPCATI